MRKQVEDVQVIGRTYFHTLPDENVSGSALQTIPDATNVTFLVFQNTGAVSVTNILGGLNGRQLRVKGDGNTTIDNNSNIKTSTGANKLLSVNGVYSFTYYQGVWYEHQS